MPPDIRARFETAFREWQLAANVNFFKRTPAQANYILIQTNASTSNSQVGLVGGAQLLNIETWRGKIEMAHELGHALGMSHEQNRPDRDTYVIIHKENFTPGIDPDSNPNYMLLPGLVVQGNYDYESLMHYPATDGNAKLVGGKSAVLIEPRDPLRWDGLDKPKIDIGQTSFLSDLDKLGMAATYGRPLNISGFVSTTDGQQDITVTISGGPDVQDSVARLENNPQKADFFRPCFGPAWLLPV